MKIYLTEPLAKQILESKEKEIEVSLDLGKTKARMMRKLLLSFPLEKVKGDFVYMFDGKELFKLAIHAQRYYSLRLFNGIPVLEIDGLRMQFVRDFPTPLEHPASVVRRLMISEGDNVLDTCTGLGYSAIEAAKKGAHVKTIEIDENVLEMAKANPWSAELFADKEKIGMMSGDSSKLIKEMPGESFDKIIHDPPRPSSAGDLYSTDFYRELLRVAKPGAKVFHYSGSVGKGRGHSIHTGIMKRMREAGWSGVRFFQHLQGVVAEKRAAKISI